MVYLRGYYTVSWASCSHIFHESGQKKTLLPPPPLSSLHRKNKLACNAWSMFIGASITGGHCKVICTNLWTGFHMLEYSEATPVFGLSCWKTYHHNIHLDTWGQSIWGWYVRYIGCHKDCDVSCRSVVTVVLNVAIHVLLDRIKYRWRATGQSGPIQIKCSNITKCVSEKHEIFWIYLLSWNTF